MTTNDLDPVYVLLHEAGLERDLLWRWLLAYWCFYHVGTASWIAQHDEEHTYWDAMRTAAASKAYPRSSERRHFRGRQATASVEWLEDVGLDELFSPFVFGDLQECDAEDVTDYVRTWRGFGPWISFKVADMLERLGLVKVRFSRDDAMYDSPRKAADLAWQVHGPNTPQAPAEERLTWVLNSLRERLDDLDAPPSGDRRLGFQEFETILCKWGSATKGSYHLGEDVAAVRAALQRFPRVRLCQRLMKAYRSAGL